MVGVLASLCLTALASDQPQNLLELPCTQASSSASACIPSKEDLKKAESAFSRALKFEKENHTEEAYHEFDTAARLVPRNVDYLTANYRHPDSCLQTSEAPVDLSVALRRV